MFHSLAPDVPLPEPLRHGAVAFGNFDGVHLGHQALMAAMKRHARSLGGPAVAVTFDPPPLALLRSGPAKIPLSTLEERTRLLQQAGADAVVVLRTDRSLLQRTPEEFFQQVILGQFAARAVVEGYNFRFGHARRGDVQLLRSLCAEASLIFEEVAPILYRDDAISSTRVRTALMQGDVRGVASLLGRNYAVEGIVVPGARRGRILGFPTANLDSVMTLTPMSGVYAGYATVGDIRTPAAANLGPNPTFGESNNKIEVHLLDFDGDLYGKNLTFSFVEFLRPTRPFSGRDDLVAQLREDIAATRKVASLH